MFGREFRSFRVGLGEVFETLFGMVLVELFGQGAVLVDEHLGAQDCGGGARREVTSPWVGRSSSSGSRWIDAVAKVLFGVGRNGNSGRAFHRPAPHPRWIFGHFQGSY